MLKTEKEYQDPAVRQLSVFCQNRVGQFRDVLRHLEQAMVAVHAISVTDSADFAVVRCIVDRTDAAIKVLKENNFAFTEATVLAVELPDDRKGLLEVCRALIRAEININFAYALITRPKGKAAVVLNVDGFAAAVEVLRRNGFTLLDEHDLSAG